MTLPNLVNACSMVAGPPAGAINVLIGEAVAGPGGRWVPCASSVTDGGYVACIFEVGPGRRQVCPDAIRCSSADDALRSATQHAALAAA